MDRSKSQWMYSLLVNDFRRGGISARPVGGAAGTRANERVKDYRHRHLKRMVLCSLVDGFSEVEYRKMSGGASYV
jgi:hypothetical protein